MQSHAEVRRLIDAVVKGRRREKNVIHVFLPAC